MATKAALAPFILTLLFVATPRVCAQDCNLNGVADDVDLIAGTSFDCNANGIPDECELDHDCNQNGVPDECEGSGDFNFDCVIDSFDSSAFFTCQAFPPNLYPQGTRCVYFDMNRDLNVNFVDFSLLQIAAGDTPISCLPAAVCEPESRTRLTVRSNGPQFNYFIRPNSDWNHGTHATGRDGRTYFYQVSGNVILGLVAAPQGPDVVFQRWNVDGANQPVGQTQITVPVSAAGPNRIATALFQMAGDVDLNGYIDGGDAAALTECLAGPVEAPNPSPPLTVANCLDAFDPDADGFVDLVGAVQFQQAFTGPAAQSAAYEVRLVALWDDPILFSPELTGVAGVTHDDATSFWRVGELASEGVRVIATNGDTNRFVHFVADAVAAGSAGELILTDVVASPGEIATTFSATQEFPLVTTVSGFDPSPDWFVGVSGLPLFVDGAWRSHIEIPLFPYDAGTFSGASFLTPGSPTVPRDPVTLLQTPQVIPTAGKLIFTRIE